DAIRARVDLDAGLTLQDGTLVLYGVTPEYAEITADTGKAHLGAGVFPGMWRIEAVDGWDNRLVTTSSLAEFASAGSILGVNLGFGSMDEGVSFIGGLDTGRGLTFT